MALFQDFQAGKFKDATPLTTAPSIPTPGNVSTYQQFQQTQKADPYKKITYFIADGSQKKEDGTNFKPGTVVFRAPQSLLDSDIYKNGILPQLKQQVSYDANGTPQHPILTKEFSSALNDVGKYINQQEDLAKDAQDRYKLNDKAAKMYAESINSALSGDGKVTLVNGKKIQTFDATKQFNNMNDDEKNQFLLDLNKTIKNGKTDEIRGRAAALFDVIGTKGNLNPSILTLLNDAGETAGGNILKAFTFGLTSKRVDEQNAARPKFLNYENYASKFGDVVGTTAGTLGTLAATGGVGGAVGKGAGKLAASGIARATTTAEDIGVANNYIRAAQMAGDYLPKAGQFAGENIAFGGTQSLQEHAERTGQVGFDNLGRDIGLSFLADAGIRAAGKGIGIARENNRNSIREALGNDPSKHLDTLVDNFNDDVEGFSKSVDDLTRKVIVPDGADGVAPRAGGIVSNSKTLNEYEAAKAVKDAGYNSDEAAQIFAKSSPKQYQGGNGYDLEDLQASAESLDSAMRPGAKGKTVFTVNDPETLGDSRNQIFDAATGQAELAQAQAAGTVANGLKLDGDVSLKASQAYEAGDKALGDRLIAEGADKASLKNIPTIYENLRKVFLKAGLQVDELDNYISRRLFSTGEKTNVSRAGLGKTSASFQNKRIHQTIMDYLKNKGEIGDINIANNLIAYMEEGTQLLKNKMLLDGFSRNGVIIYAPIKNTSQEIQGIVKGGHVERFVSSGDYLRNLTDAKGRPKYVEITDANILRTLGSKENSYGTRTAVYTDPDTAAFLVSQFTDRLSANSKIAKGLDSFATFSRNVQNFRTAGGVPATPLNNLAFTQNIITALTDPGSIPQIVRNFTRAFSNDAVKLYTLDNSKALSLMSKHGVNPFGGEFLGGKTRGQAVSLVEDAMGEVAKVAGNKRNIADLGESLDNVVSSATFNNLNMNQVEIWKREFNRLVGKRGEAEAARIASARIKNFYGLKTAAEQGQGPIARLVGRDTAQRLQTIMISAPRYKALNINRLVNTIKAFNPMLLKSANRAKIAEYKLNYQLAAAALLVYAAQMAITHHFSGKWMSAIGATGEGQFPIGGGNIGRVNLFAPLTQVPRSIGRGLDDLATGDPGGALDELFSNTGYGLQPLVRTLANKKFGDQTVFDPESSPGGRIADAIGYIASQYTSHPYVSALNKLAKGDGWGAVTQSLELPFSVSNVRKVGQQDFNYNVVPDVQDIVEEHEKAIASAYTDAGEIDIPKQNEIFRDMIHDVKERVEMSGKKYGYSSSDLTDAMSSKLVSLIVGKDAVPLGGYDNLDGQQQAQTASNERLKVRESGAEQGLDLYKFGDTLDDANNKIYGAPKRIAYEFDRATKADKKNGIPSLYDQRKKYDDAITQLYDRAKTQTGADKTATYAQISQIQKAYMTDVFDKRIQPLIEKYGTSVLANNSDVFKELQSYIMVPNDLTPYASSKKQPYLTADVKQYLKDRYGVGPLNSANIATDPQVIDAIKKANGQIQNGRYQSAVYTLKRTRDDIAAGKSFADPETMDQIAARIKALNTRGGGGSGTRKTPRSALRVTAPSTR